MFELMTEHDATLERAGPWADALRPWIPAGCMMLVSVISYVDRNTLAILAPTIRKETGLSNERYTWIISAFSIAYMIGNPVWGRWLDRLGVRMGMLLAVAFWTAASASHALAVGFWSFALARAALGFGEGATFPGGLRTAVLTLGVAQRARGVAIAYSGGSLGAIVAPLVVAPIFDWWGWRAAFLFTGCIGAAWLALWWIVSQRPDLRHDSSREPTPPSGEIGMLSPDLPSASAAQVVATARPLEFTDPRVWSFMIVYSFGALPIAFVLYTSSLYLDQKLGVQQATINKLLWLPPLGW
jgi:ACS family hexuronate transporter-like MFS transporter